MLSRHFLRTKVLQQVYACEADPVEIRVAEKNFEHTIRRLNDLGTKQLSLLTELVSVAEVMFEEGRQKFRPTQEDINPNTRILENVFLRTLRDNLDLRRQCDIAHVNWMDEMDNFRRVFASMRTTSFYCDYLKGPQGFEADQAFVLQMFKYMVNDAQLRECFFDENLLWEDDFDQIAQYNFMMLKAFDITFDESSIIYLMHDIRSEKDEDAYNFAHELLLNTLRHRKEGDEMVARHLTNWDFDRVALMDVLLLNMAIAELTSCPSIPERVTVDEYIELSKEFSTERSKLFINGILDKIMIELRSAGRINKSGRGLVDLNYPDYR